MTCSRVSEASCVCEACRRDRKLEKARAAQKRYADRNRERILERRREAYRASPDEDKARARAWYREHHDRARETRRAYAAADPQRKKDQDRIYYERNRDAKIARQREWERANPERVNARRREWYRANLERARKIKAGATARRRARKLAATGHHTRDELLAKWEANHHSCAYCLATLNAAEVTADHIVPLSKGGGDGIENIAPACRRCNQRKHVKSAEEFFAILAAEGY